MEQSFIEQLFHAHKEMKSIPSPSQACDWVNGVLKFLFPELADSQYPSKRAFEQIYQNLKLELFHILERVEHSLPIAVSEVEQKFWSALPEIHARLLDDANAIHAGDPAAVSETEVIRTYPGFHAIAVHRLANMFHKLQVPLIPRILSEDAHRSTGIDIHPGAQIGRRFCIDHGTGIVIGETVNIGNNVKLYQGVTLGALSVKKEMAKMKRHPTIEDNVIIYAGATILGGETVIGHDSIIGGSVWVTESVPPNSTIYYKVPPQLVINNQS